MMDKTIKQSLFIFVLSNLLILCLYLLSDYFVVDALIVDSNLFAFVLNNIYIALLYKTASYYHSIKTFVLIRVGNKKFDDLLVTHLLKISIITILFGYVLPILFYFNKIISLYHYITFIVILYFLFILYITITFLYTKASHRYLKPILFLLPFTINIAIQIFFFQFFY